MTVCRGCWGDDLHGPDTVLMTMGEDPFVGHPARPDCPIVDQPHRMSECPAFGDQLREVTPSDELAPCPSVPEPWLERMREIRADYYSDAVGLDRPVMTEAAPWPR